MCVNPAVRDPDYKIGMIKSDFFYNNERKMINANKKIQLSHPLHIRDILKYSE